MAAESKWVAIGCAGSLVIGFGAVAACIWRPDAISALTLIPAWCLLFAGVIALAPAWRVRRRRAACLLTVLWLAFAVGWVEELSSLTRSAIVTIRSGSAPAGRPLRIVSLNCANDHRCVADLQRAQPDVVLIQEAPGEEALADMAAQLFGDAGHVLAGGDTAILARGRVTARFVDRRTHFVAGTVVFENGGRLNCVSLRLATPVSRLDFWSGGFWDDHRQLRALHRRQLREVLARAGEFAPASGFVVGGDFNAPPIDRALDEIRPGLADSFARAGLGWGATGTNAWPLFRVDQVWTNPAVTVTQVTAEKTRYSDHRMVVCDVSLQR